eukprot:scaffold21328_cov57-Phaeocystis_antarctica.AAC.4
MQALLHFDVELVEIGAAAGWGGWLKRLASIVKALPFRAMSLTVAKMWSRTAQRPALLSSRWSSRRAASAAAPFGETLSGAYFTWWVMVGTSATLEAAGSRLPCNGWVRWEPSGLASASECRAVQSRQARPEEAQQPS